MVERKLMKRCYGCGKVLWPWQDTQYTKRVGRIHKACTYYASEILKSNLWLDTSYIEVRRRKRLDEACDYLGVETKKKEELLKDRTFVDRNVHGLFSKDKG